MNRKYLLSLAIIPVVLTIFLSDSINSGESVQASQTLGIGTGHFEVTVKDSMGYVTAYRQSDNAVVNTGENCVAKMIFRHPTNAGTGVCVGSTSASWNFMCLDEDPAIAFTDRELRNAADETGLAACVSAAITWNQNSTGSTDALSKVTLRLSNVFTNSGVASETIAAVGLFNSSTVTTNSMLSKANFTATAVPVASTLTVNYDYEVGGGTVP